jgi:hypothetical protein
MRGISVLVHDRQQVQYPLRSMARNTRMSIRHEAWDICFGWQKIQTELTECSKKSFIETML